MGGPNNIRKPWKKKLASAVCIFCDCHTSLFINMVIINEHLYGVSDNTVFLITSR